MDIVFSDTCVLHLPLSPGRSARVGVARECVREREMSLGPSGIGLCVTDLRTLGFTKFLKILLLLLRWWFPLPVPASILGAAQKSQLHRERQAGGRQEAGRSPASRQTSERTRLRRSRKVARREENKRKKRKRQKRGRRQERTRTAKKQSQWSKTQETRT